MGPLRTATHLECFRFDIYTIMWDATQGHFVIHAINYLERCTLLDMYDWFRQPCQQVLLRQDVILVKVILP